MLVKFAIDPQALLSDPQPLQFDRLVDRWENYGVLVNTEELEDAIDSYEINIKSRLQEILKDDDPPRRFRFLEDAVSQVNWETLDDKNIGILADWADVFELAVLNDELAFFINASNSPLSLDDQRALCGDVEPIAFSIGDQARSWRQASAISRRGFGTGEVHEALWNEHFSRLAESSGVIVIIDAYALHDPQIYGFVKLLEFIDRDASSCRVILFSSPVNNNDASVEGIRKHLCEAVRKLDGGGVQQVTVRLFDSSDDDSRRMLHDRRIRFDRTVFAPENSIALVFCGDKGVVSEDIGCALQLSNDEYLPFEDMKTKEGRLRERAVKLKWLATEKDLFVLRPNQLRE